MTRQAIPAATETKVAVLEVSLNYLSESLTETKNLVQKTIDAIDETNHRLDRWNGSIPKIAEAVDRIEDILNTHIHFSSKLTDDLTVLKTRFGIIWKGFALTGGVLITALATALITLL